MNIIHKLTLRHMRLNKRRTLVTILGIAISVAMITAVSVVGYSFMDYMGRSSLENNGYYHVKFENFLYEDNDTILDKMSVSRYCLTQVVGDYGYELDEDGNLRTFSYLEKLKELEDKKQTQDNVFDEDENTYNEPISVMRVLAVDSEFYKMHDIQLASGNYPANSDEILVSEPMMTKGCYGKNVGDKIIIGDKEYTICGFIAGLDCESKNISLPDARTFAMYTYLDVGSLSKEDIVSGYYYSEGIKDNFETRVEETLDFISSNDNLPTYEDAAKDGWYCNGATVDFNYSVLQYYGISEYTNLNMIMDTIKLILIIVVMVGSISLIVNGFAISLSERSKQLGILASIGATKKQKRSSVYFEGLVEGVISIPLGILVGIGGIAITFMCIQPLMAELSHSDVKLLVVVNWQVILWTVAFSCLTIFLSAYIPARRASKIAPIDAVRQARDVKITGKTVKTMGITRKIFGFEGDLALKNLKRNKKRYRVTVFSLFISLTLFISIYSLVFYVKETYFSEMEDIGYDVGMVEFVDVSGDGYDKEQVIDKVKNNELSSEGYKTLTKKLKESQYAANHNSYIAPSFMATISINVDSLEDFNKDYLKFFRKGYEGYSDKELLQYISPGLSILTMNDDDLKTFLEDIGVNYDAFTKDKRSVIFFDNIREVQYSEEGGRNVFEGSVLPKDVDSITVKFADYDSEQVMEKYIEYKVLSNCDKLSGMYSFTTYILVNKEAMAEILSICDASGFEYRTFIEATDADKLIKLYESEYDPNKMLPTFDMNNMSEAKRMMEDAILLISVFAYGFIILMALICVANIVNTISTSLALRKREFAMLKSVGMTDKAFNKMIAYESAFYGIKALLFGLPVGTLVMLIVRMSISEGYTMTLGVPWMGYVIAILGVFIVIGVTMLYSAKKIKKANVIDALRQENV